MSRLVEQALQTARLVDTERQLALQDADLAEIVSRAVSAMLPFAAMAGREIHTAGITRRIPVIVDPEKVHTIVVNLIDNAIKYSSSGTPVQCTVERRGRLATVSVEDRGPGIPRDQLPRLFSQFGRLKTPTRVGGVGLGLYLSRMLARLHHGDLEVDSVEGAGSTFTLMLPAGRRPASRAELAPAAHG
jgi:signal transduction histidine kinase